MISAPQISVVIPVRNEASGLADCLHGILSQTVPVLEILVIDSGSTDGSQDIVRRFEKTRLIEIPPSEFNHGGTRNLGVRESRGDYVLFTVGDARPVDEHWIERLLQGFVSEDVLAVSGVQVVPHGPKTNPIEWFRPVSKPVLSFHRFGSAEKYDAAAGPERHAACVVDDVATLYRRRAFEVIPFRHVIYGEDILFAIDALRAGLALARNPAARVYHFHLDNYTTTLKRTVAVAVLRYELFGILPDLPKSRPLRIALRLIRERRVSWRDKLRWWRYNVELIRALSDGISMVRQAVSEGSESLTRLHEKFAGSPPVPIKGVQRGQP